jgi:hypothetical protein
MIKAKPIPLPLSAKTLARFWAKVDKNGPVPPAAPHLGKCWLWTGALNEDGYGHFWITSHGTFRAHRVAYAIEHGRDIAAGLEPDHLCRHVSCIRASHLDAVTSRINTLRGASIQAQNARKTHCVHGHPLSGENLLIYKGRRQRCCRACRSQGVRRLRKRINERVRKYYARMKDNPDWLARRRKRQREWMARRRKAQRMVLNEKNLRLF